MDTITAKILVFFLSLFILIVVAHQVALLFEDTYDTETAIIYSSADKISFNGIYVRNESVVTSGTDGVLSYPNPDGSKIAKDSVVAYVYKSENDIFINQQIEKLEKEVELLKKEQNPGTTAVAQPEFISGLIDEKYQTVTALIARNDLANLRDERDDFQSLLGIYQIVINEETNYNDRIDALNQKIEELKKKRSEPINKVTVENSGYFISYVDGYENKLSPDKLADISAEDIREIIDNGGYNSQNVSRYAVGKVVDGYNWNLIGLTRIDESVFKLGSDVTVKLSSTPDVVNAKIENIIPDEDSDESIIILSCDKLNYNLVQYRTERVELILNDFEGIKVPREAIRFNKNNEMGVYILLGQKISFKKLDVIFECEDYFLSAVTSDSDYISMYDDIIVEGEIDREMVDFLNEENDKEETTIGESSVTDVTNESVSETSASGDDESAE